MSTDSAVTMDFGDSFEYKTGRKAYCFPGVGCVTTWGTRDANNIGEFLQSKNLTRKITSVDELAELVKFYLTNIYKPHELDLDDVGYHVCGFKKPGIPCIYHVFWGFDRPRKPEQVTRNYKLMDHSSFGDNPLFLYNGRNDLAEIMIKILLSQIYNNFEIQFNLNSITSIVSFSDFIMRFASELTPEVGPPFITHILSQQNQVITLRNERFSPMNLEMIEKKLHKLDCS
jgi:hypothetical protein